MLKMDEINKIRKSYSNGKTIYELSKQFNRSWNTINRIVKTSREELCNRGKRGRKSSVITPKVISAIEEILSKEKKYNVKKKQRYTATKIFDILTEKGIYKGSERSMMAAVKQLRMQRGGQKIASFLPLDFSFGSALQLDHGEVECEISGSRWQTYLFVASVPGSSLRYCQLMPIKKSEAWGEFHERAFKFFGGIFSKVIYDNDSVLIKKVLKRKHYQTDFSLSLEEHYGFKSHFCNVSSGNEKGAVENAVGFCRRNYLAGYPTFSNWNKANTFLETLCKNNIEKGCNYKTNEPLKAIFDETKKHLQPLLPPYEWRNSQYCKVNSYQLVNVNNHRYSVPERFVGASVCVFSKVFQIDIFKDDELIASHPRRFVIGNDSLCLDHYLEQLRKKVSAFWDSKPVKQHQFSEDLKNVWKKLLERNERREATYKFIEILFLNRNYKLKDINNAIQKSFSYGCVEPIVIENIIKQMHSPKMHYDENILKRHLPDISIPHLQFDLSQYSTLCKEV